MTPPTHQGHRGRRLASLAPSPAAGGKEGWGVTDLLIAKMLPFPASRREPLRRHIKRGFLGLVGHACTRHSHSACGVRRVPGPCVFHRDASAVDGRRTVHRLARRRDGHRSVDRRGRFLDRAFPVHRCTCRHGGHPVDHNARRACARRRGRDRNAYGILADGDPRRRGRSSDSPPLERIDAGRHPAGRSAARP